MRVRLVLALIIGIFGFSQAAGAQSPPPDPEDIVYDSISGNAFHFVAETTGTDVEVVAFGPDSVDSTYGMVIRNFTSAPVYTLEVTGTVHGDDGETQVITGPDSIAPEAIPPGGIAIFYGIVWPGDEVGDNAEPDVEIAYQTEPRSDGEPLLPVPVQSVERDDDEILATSINETGVEIYVPALRLLCFDDDGAITGAFGAIPEGEAITLVSFAVGYEAHFIFNVGDTACDWFLVAGTAEDKSSDMVGSVPLPADATAPGPLSSTAGDDGGTTEQLVTDCSPFASFEEAQAYYAEHPDAQPIIDPDFDGYACEVYFGVDPQSGGTGQPGSDQPADVPPAQPDMGGGCDPSYPTLCIPIGSPDLDCGEVGAWGFPVLPPDPHGFDGDQDGIGCEG